MVGLATGYLAVPAAILSAAAWVSAFTPQGLLGAPRRSDAVPNKAGTLAVFSASQYSFETHSSSSAWSLLDLATGETSVLFNDTAVSEVAWLGTDDSSIVYVNASTGIPSGIELWITDVAAPTSGYAAASIPAPLGGLKLVVTPSGDISFLLSGLAYQNNGSAYNEDLTAAPLSSARIYDTPFVRHWGVYITPQRYSVFSGTLTAGKSTFSLSGEVKNLLFGIPGLESPVQPFGGSGDYDLSPDGSTAAFLSKDPKLPAQNHTASYIYLVPHDGFALPVPLNGPLSPGTPSLARGASAAPVFSPDGKSIIYFQQDEDSYESDRFKTYIASAAVNSTIRGLATAWDRSPSSAIWTSDGATLYLGAEEFAREKIWEISSSGGVNATPKEIIGQGAVSSVYLIQNETALLVNANSMVSSTGFLVKSLVSNSTKILLAPNLVDPELKGLAHEQIDEFWFDGETLGTKVHSWIVKPIDFQPNSTYPLAFLVHGGPQGAWDDAWSTRWNPAVFANQGYVAVLVDFTGSTGYGKVFEDSIQNNWGGTPYLDLVKGYEYVVENYPYIDTSRAVAAGASYGGYMMNWIQGNPLGRKFKALVTHDGVFSTLDQYSSEELWFPQHDFNGTIWNNRSNYERWDPAKLAKNWETPHLVVHSDLDYRLPIAEGMSLFNVLQERGVPSRFLNFPDEDHWVLKPENSLVWHSEVLGWLNKYSGVNGGVVKLS